MQIRFSSSTRYKRLLNVLIMSPGCHWKRCGLFIWPKSTQFCLEGRSLPFKLNHNLQTQLYMYETFSKDTETILHYISTNFGVGLFIIEGFSLYSRAKCNTKSQLLPKIIICIKSAQNILYYAHSVNILRQMESSWVRLAMYLKTKGQAL